MYERLTASIEALKDQDYSTSVVLFSEYPRRLEAYLFLDETDNMSLTFRFTFAGELIKETPVLRQAIDAFNEL